MENPCAFRGQVDEFSPAVLSDGQSSEGNGRTERGADEPRDTQTLGTFRTYRQILARHRAVASVTIAVSVTAGAAEALALASLVPILRREGAHHGTVGIVYVIAFTLCALLAVILRVVSDVLIVRLNGAVEKQLRIELLDSLLRLDWRRAASFRRGDLLSALMSETKQIANGVSAFLMGTSALSVASVLAAAAFLLGGALTLGAIVFVAVSVVLFRKAGHLAARSQREFGRENADLYEEAGTLLHGLKYFRSSGTANGCRTRLGEATERVRRSQLGSDSVPLITKGCIEAFGALFITGVLLVPVLQGGDAATALMFVAVFSRTVPRLQAAQSQLLTARFQAVWWSRWCAHHRSMAGWALHRSDGDRPIPEEIRSVELQAATVDFPGRKAGVHGISVRFQRGLTYAIIGETGGGKSTLIDMVTGLIRPDTGRVLVDGVPLEDYDVTEWQKSIAFVPQDPVVFHGTIRHNIVWPGDGEDENAVHAALRAAQLSEFIRSLPNDLETSVGQGGSALSGGQRQRVGVARALFANRPVLVLDEATGALDPETETLLLDEVLLRKADRITLIVTHRHEAARRVDEVIVVREGQVVSVGSPEEILGGSHAAV